MRRNLRGILSHDEVNRLTDAIMAFLIECGGPYGKVIGCVQENIILSLATGQYVLGTEHGEINYFASYWKIQPEDLEQIKQMKRPANITEGPIMYVSECGCQGNMAELARRLRRHAKRMTDACWHRGDDFKKFTLQREI